MPRSRIDRAFRRFCASGDPHALAEVFDATAPELYRLAWHLVGNRHSAEDLVQATFLVAIRDAKSFDRRRGALPWLSGILANRALDQRRTLRSRSKKQIPPRTVEEGDPVKAAAASELSEVVTAKIRSLPEPYRQVLMLYLLHELSAKEIADAIDRPDATVRSQIQRGLELLRKMLPVTIAGVARASAPATTLATVRTAVLTQVGFPVGGITAAFGGLVMMKKVILGGVALALLFLCAWPMLSPDKSPSSIGARDSRTLRSETVSDQPTEPLPPLPVGRQVVEVADPRTSVTLEVAVHWAEDGRPAPDVTVRYQPNRTGGDLFLRSAPTDVDGIARFRGVETGPAKVIGDRGGRTEVEIGPAPLQRIELELPPGLDIHGIVVGPDERPIAGAEVWISIDGSTDDGEPVLHTGADGRFLLHGVERGRVVSAVAPGFSTATVERVILDKAAEEMVLRMRPAPGVLIGQVLFPNGRPVPDARVLIGAVSGDNNNNAVGRPLGQDSWPSRFLRTDQEGRFFALGLPPLKWPIWVRAPGHAPWRGEAVVDEHVETRLTVRLQSGARISGRTTNPEGSPVAGTRVWGFYEPQKIDRRIALFPVYNMPTWVWIEARTAETGDFAFNHLMPGKLNLWASHDREGRAEMELELNDGQLVTWNPVLSHGLILHGIVFDPDGQPLPGWRVNLTVDDRTATVRTDSEGRFQLNNTEDQDYLVTVKAVYPALGIEVDAGEGRSGSGPIRVQVPWDSIPSGTITGEIVAPNGGSPGDLRLNLSLIRDGRRASTNYVSTEDGQFHSPLLVPGRYRIQTNSNSYGSQRIGEWQVVRGGKTDIGAHQLEQAGRLTVEVRGTGGQRILDAWLNVYDGDVDYGPVIMKEGRGEKVLPPGRYAMATHGGLTMTMQEIDILAGRTLDMVFHVPDGLRFRVRLPPIRKDPYSFQETWRDGSGTVVFRDRQSLLRSSEPQLFERWIPAAGNYTIEIRDLSGRTAETTVEIRAADPPVVVDLRLPAHE